MGNSQRNNFKHSKRKANNPDRLRQSLANETAKIIALEGVRDFQRAKNKACQRLGNSQHGSLPSNLEIEQALSLYQQTFIPNHDEIIKSQLHAALEVMQWLCDYSPYLAGSVVDGAVSVNSVITVHVSCSTVETIYSVLQEKNISLEISQRGLKLFAEVETFPAICFQFQEFEFEVIVFSLRQQFQNPRSKSHNGRMRRLNLKKLQQMVAIE